MSSLFIAAFPNLKKSFILDENDISQTAAFAHVCLSPVLVSVQQNALLCLNVVDSQCVRSFFFSSPFSCGFFQDVGKEEAVCRCESWSG